MNPDELSDAEVEELLGAYALDALEPDEVVAVEAVLARRPDLALRGRPPVERGRVARRHRGHRTARRACATACSTPRSARRRGPADPVIDVYLSLSDRLEQAIVDLPDDALDVVTPNGLTAARAGRAHGRAGEPARAEPRHPHASTTSHEEDIVAAHARAPARASPVVSSPTQSRSGATRWRRTGRGRSPTPTAPRSGAASGSPVTTRCSCGRSRRGSTPTTSAAPPGRRVTPPDVRHLTLMSDLAGRILPARAGGVAGASTTARPPASCSRAPAVATGWCRWAAAPRAATEPDVTVTADVVDWCLLVGDRDRARGAPRADRRRPVARPRPRGRGAGAGDALRLAGARRRRRRRRRQRASSSSSGSSASTALISATMRAISTSGSTPSAVVPDFCA